jgi:hypothetical protein
MPHVDITTDQFNQSIIVHNEFNNLVNLESYNGIVFDHLARDISLHKRCFGNCSFNLSPNAKLKDHIPTDLYQNDLSKTNVINNNDTIASALDLSIPQQFNPDQVASRVIDIRQLQLSNELNQFDPVLNPLVISLNNVN